MQSLQHHYKEEIYILDALEAGNMGLSSPSEKEIEAIKSAVKHHTEGKLRMDMNSSQ